MANPVTGWLARSADALGPDALEVTDVQRNRIQSQAETVPAEPG
jgi:hypothetical protein